MKDFFKKKRNIKLNKVLFFIIILIFFSHFNEKKSYAVFNIDIHGGYASIPSNLVDNVDHNFHTGLGIGVDIFRIQPWIMWQFRMEFDSHLFLYGDIPIRSNFPLFFGSRFIFGGGELPKWIVFFTDLAYILRIKRDIVAGDFQLITHSFGLGIGIEFFATNFFYIGGYFRVYFIDMFYFYGGPVIGFRL